MAEPGDPRTAMYQRPVELLQQLIRFDTTNPPGNERDCVLYIRDLLANAGIASTILARDPQRPNLVARLPGRGQAPAILFQGHVDVVTTAGQQWTRDPFAGQVADGWVWGRGALDMKAGVAMMLTALLRGRAEGLTPPGDVVLAVLADEENFGDYGARFLVEQHPEVFAGVRYAIGEFGGFTLYAGGKRFYPIQVAEKQVCIMRLTVRGEGGHGSLPVRGGAMARLGWALARLDRQRLPVHVTPVVRDMLGGMAGALGGMQRLLLSLMLNPAFTNRILDRLGEKSRMFDALLHNTASPTVIHASDKVNVIPAEVVVELDCRLLPGRGPDEVQAELRQLLGPDAGLEVARFDPYPHRADMGLFDTLAGILRRADPEGVPIPLLLPGVTDGRFFARLGIQPYGFTPMQLPPDFAFTAAIHGADERIPTDALRFGSDALYALLSQGWAQGGR